MNGSIIVYFTERGYSHIPSGWQPNIRMYEELESLRFFKIPWIL